MAANRQQGGYLAAFIVAFVAVLLGKLTRCRVWRRTPRLNRHPDLPVAC